MPAIVGIILQIFIPVQVTEKELKIDSVYPYKSADRSVHEAHLYRFQLSSALVVTGMLHSVQYRFSHIVGCGYYIINNFNKKMYTNIK